MQTKHTNLVVASIFTLLFLYAGVASAQCLPAGNYTINALQPASSTNYQSFNAAVSAMSCGIQGAVTFTVAYGSGPYNEQVTIPRIPGASPTARVTFDGQHRDSTLLTHNASIKYATLLLDSADNITIRNLTIESNTLGAGFGIQLTHAADSNTIQHVRVLHDVNTTNTGAYGIVVSASETSASAEGNNANYLLIDDAIIVGGYGGIRIEGKSTDLLKKNRITNCHITQTYNIGILTDDSDSLIISYNYINDIRDETNGDGLHNSDVRGYFELIGNEVYAPDWGILVTNGNANNLGIRAKIINNFVYSTDDNALLLMGNKKVDVYHNTFKGTIGAKFLSNCDELDVRNNIFYATLSYAIDDNSADALGARYTKFNYNLYYTDGPDLARYGGNSNIYTSLTDWQVAYPTYNVNSLQGKPVFYGPTDLHLLDTLANNKGDNSVGVLTDIDMDGRPLAPSTRVDIGADEYNPFSVNVAVIGLYGPASADCGDSTGTVSVIIYNQGETAQSGFAIDVAVTSTMGTENISTVYGGTIAPWTYDTVVVGNVNTYPGGVFSFFINHQLAGDQYPANDSLTVTLGLLANIGAPTAIGDTGCVGTTLELNANATGYLGLEWYSDANLTNNLTSGDTYFTPVLNASSTYYVQGQLGLKERAGKDTVGATFNYFVSETPGWGLLFNITHTIILDSVTMYPRGTGDFRVVIYETSSNGLVYTSPLLTAGGVLNKVQYQLGATLAPGSYVIGLANTTNGVDFRRDQSGAAAPYVSPSGFVEVKGGVQGFGGTPSQSLYYWFYDWVVRIPSCYTDATPVVAFISDSTANAGADTAICLGATATLTAVNGADWIWSTTEVTNSIQVTPSDTTTYTLTITDANGCPGQPDDVQVIVNPLPNVYAGVDTAICDGQSVTLLAVGANTYVWSNTQNTNTNTVTAAGNYGVTGTDVNGCVGSDDVNVTVNPLPNVTASADTSICEGNTVTLSATGGIGYAWSTTETTDSIDVTPTGTTTYTVTAIDQNACSAADAVTVSVNTLPTVIFDVVSTVCDTDQVLVLTATPTGGVFSGPGVANGVFDFAGLSVPGSFTLQYTYTDGNQCQTVADDDVEIVICTGIEEIAGLGQLNIYPNPFADVIRIQFDAIDVAPINVTLYNLLGEQLYTEMYSVEQNENHYVIAIANNLAAGAYVIEVKQGDLKYRQQMVHIK